VGSTGLIKPKASGSESLLKQKWNVQLMTNSVRLE
jgi:hypothetical protein